MGTSFSFLRAFWKKKISAVYLLRTSQTSPQDQQLSGRVYTCFSDVSWVIGSHVDSRNTFSFTPAPLMHLRGVQPTTCIQISLQPMPKVKRTSTQISRQSVSPGTHQNKHLHRILKYFPVTSHQYALAFTLQKRCGSDASPTTSESGLSDCITMCLGGHLH